MERTPCECADPGCPAHKNSSKCNGLATIILYRIDMNDATGTAMCDACADDALESGVFSN
jgi:hypothetical protein